MAAVDGQHIAIWQGEPVIPSNHAIVRPWGAGPSLCAALWPVAIMGQSGMKASPPSRILVIDDNVDLADMFAMLLEANGFIVQVAYSGLSGLEMTASFAPDMIICDIGMPGLSGHDVAQRIRMRTLSCHPKLIAVSGWGDARMRAASLDAGFDRHLTKPVSVDQIIAMFDEVGDAS